jgi:hypothetical protein
MPIVAEHHETKRRSAPSWVLAPLLALLLPVGLFVWSFFQPVSVPLGESDLEIRHWGKLPPAIGYLTTADEALYLRDCRWWWSVELPGGRGWGMGLFSRNSLGIPGLPIGVPPLIGRAGRSGMLPARP